MYEIQGKWELKRDWELGIGSWLCYELHTNTSCGFPDAPLPCCLGAFHKKTWQTEVLQTSIYQALLTY